MCQLCQCLRFQIISNSRCEWKSMLLEINYSKQGRIQSLCWMHGHDPPEIESDAGSFKLKKDNQVENLNQVWHWTVEKSANFQIQNHSIAQKQKSNLEWIINTTKNRLIAKQSNQDKTDW